MPLTHGTQERAGFLDMQAEVGITKHPGGYPATDELLALCHIDTASRVLNVGCGIGVASTYLARKFGCRVVAIDRSPQMVSWSQQRAWEEGVAGHIDLVVADLLAMPFASDQFDIVFCESVLNFVGDKPRAIDECKRVTVPGGYVGINEMFWLSEAISAFEGQVSAILGTQQALLTKSGWQALWEASGLAEETAHIHPVDVSREVRDRIHWVGWRWIVRAWGRALRLYGTKPAVRNAIKEQFRFPIDVMSNMGYGVFVGRKPLSTF